MKKILAVLLALCVAAGAFAQVTTAISGYGEIDLIDQDLNATFVPYGSGYDTFTFKATNADGNAGFSMTDGDWTTDGIFTIRDWNAWFKGKYTKVILGKLRNADFRATLPNDLYANYLYGFDRISGQGVLFESTTLGGLTLGLNLPVGTTAAATVDVLEQSDIAVKYAIADVGTVYALANLDIVNSSNIFQLGFKYTGVENLTAAVIYKGTFAAASTHAFALGADYSMDKLGFAFEFDGSYAAAFAGEVALRATYAVADNMTAALKGMYDFDGSYDVKAYFDVDYGTGLGSEVLAGYNGAFYWDLALTYGFSF